MGCCASLAGMAGVQTPQISDEQVQEIMNLVFNQLGEYTPKFSVAFCAIMCEEAKKQRKGGPYAPLEMKSEEIDKQTEHAIKMADAPDFDPTTVTAAKKKEEEEDKEQGWKDKAGDAVDAALDDDDGDDGDDDGSGASNVTSETVRDAVVENLGPMKTDLQGQMAGVPEQISGPAIDGALKKVVEKGMTKLLAQFAILHVKEWNKLVKEHKNPTRIFKRGQKICKTIKDVKSLADDVTSFVSAAEDGNALDAARAAKGGYDDANSLKDDKQNMEQIKKGKDDDSHSGGE